MELGLVKFSWWHETEEAVIGSLGRVVKGWKTLRRLCYGGWRWRLPERIAAEAGHDGCKGCVAICKILQVHLRLIKLGKVTEEAMTG